MAASLVTGAAGFAGAHLVSHLLESEPLVMAWSNPGGQSQQVMHPRVKWAAVDLLDRQAVEATLRDIRPSAIYHCAGVADVGAAWERPERALQVNALGTHHLLDGVARLGLDCPVLVTGSALIYLPSTTALGEDSPIGPSSPYGVSKLAQEMVTLQSVVSSAFLARPFNHAGPGQSASFVTSAFARQVAEIEAGLKPPVLRVGNLEARRDITDVRDVVRAYTQLLASGQSRRPYNVCSGQAYRVADLLDLLLGMARVRVTVEYDPSKARPSDNPVVLGDRSRISGEVGWTPQIPIERTLEDLLQDWRRRVVPSA